MRSVGIRLPEEPTDPKVKWVRIRIRVRGEWLESIYHALLPDLEGKARLDRHLEIEGKESMSKARAFLNSNLTLIDAAFRSIEKVNK